MEPGGIEPRDIRILDGEIGCDAQIDAHHDPDLARVVGAWPNMPDQLRAVVLAVVDSLTLVQGAHHA